jgi:hypothetical protein
MAKHITRTISNDAFWAINKHLHRQLGLRTTLLLQHFIDLQTKLFHNNEFFQSYKQIEDTLCLTEHHIKDSIKRLKEAGVVTVVKKGMPAKNYYFVLINRVEELLSLDSGISSVKSDVPQTIKLQPTSEVKITLQDSGKSPNKSSDNQPTYKRINNKRIKEKEIIKNTSTDSSQDIGELNIIKRLLNDLTQYEDVDKFKLSYSIIEEEYGNLSIAFDKLGFDDSQKNNWTRKINNVILNNQAV